MKADLLSSAVAKEKNNQGLRDDVRPPKDFAEYDRQWLERYRKLSFQMGLYTAIAGATFFGMFATFSKMFLTKVAGKKVDYHPKKTPLAMGGMMSMGVVFAYAATRKEAQRQKLEDDRLAHRIVAGKEATGTSVIGDPTETDVSSMSQEQQTQWRELVRKPQQEAHNLARA